MELFRGQAEESAETDGVFEMLGQILAPEPGAHLRVGGDGRAFPVLRHDDPLAFELEVGALDRDDADAQRDGQLANRGDLLPASPVSGGDSLVDLLHDLEVHRPSIGLGNNQVGMHHRYTVYINILSIYSQGQSSGKRHA